jgi:hypothetical protein
MDQKIENPGLTLTIYQCEGEEKNVLGKASRAVRVWAVKVFEAEFQLFGICRS